jgi:hypothetical protein
MDLHKVLTRSNKVSPRTSRTALVLGFTHARISVFTFSTRFVYPFWAPRKNGGGFLCHDKTQNVTLFCFREYNYRGWRWAAVFVIKFNVFNLKRQFYIPHQQCDILQGLPCCSMQIPDLQWWMSFLFGTQFNKSRSQWLEGNSQVISYYPPLPTFCFHQQRKIQSHTNMLLQKAEKPWPLCFIKLHSWFSQAAKTKEVYMHQTCLSRNRHWICLWGCSCSQVVKGRY